MIRAREGCDVAQTLGRPFVGRARPLFAITCSRCSGSDDDCPVCEGSGEERVYRCAGSIVDRDCAEVMHAHAAHEEGMLLEAGALEDQAAPCIDLVRAVSSELGRIRDEDRRDAERRASRSRARSAAGRAGGRAPNRA